MFTSPEVYDEVELLEALPKGEYFIEAGTKGYVGYASYSGYFVVNWKVRHEGELKEVTVQYGQADLGKKLKIVQTRRGRKKTTDDIVPHKGR